MGRNSKKTVLNNIKKLREKLKLTREEMSLLLEFDNSYMGKIENGNGNLRVETLDMLAEFFQIPTSDILKEEIKPPHKRKNKVDYKNSEIRKIIGENIAKYRIKTGLSKEVLSKKLGFSISYIRKAEAGQLNITIDKIQSIADLLDIQIIDLLR